MKIFLDSNILTYWAKYEGYIIEGEYDDLLQLEHTGWQQEIHALKHILELHERASFRFAVSPTIVEEMTRSRSRRWEAHLVELVVEHTRDCLNEEHIQFTDEAVSRVITSLRPVFVGVTNDCRAVAEAIVMQCDIFLTNDGKLVNKEDPRKRIEIMRPSEVAEMWSEHL